MQRKRVDAAELVQGDVFEVAPLLGCRCNVLGEADDHFAQQRGDRQDGGLVDAQRIDRRMEGQGPQLRGPVCPVGVRDPLTVLRSTPSDTASALFERPAYQWT